MITWTRIQRPLGRHASCTGKKRVGHSPTLSKYWEKRLLNSGAQRSRYCVTTPTLLPGPRYTRGPSICQPYLTRGAHLDRVHCVATCRVSAPCAPPAPRSGHPWLCHVASVPRRTHAVVPCATCQLGVGPAHHVSICR